MQFIDTQPGLENMCSRLVLLESTVIDLREKINQLTEENAIIRQNAADNYAVINRQLDLMRAQSLKARPAAPLLESTVVDQQKKINQLTEGAAITQQNATDNYAAINHRLELIEARPAAPVTQPRATVPASSTLTKKSRRYALIFV